MPRSVPPTQNPYAHDTARLAPYARREVSTMSPSNSDKENTTPPTPEQSQRTRVLASQTAFRAMMTGDQTHSKYYDPYDRAKIKKVRKAYQRLHKRFNENTKEYLMPRNEGIKDTQEEANVLFEDGVRTLENANLDSSLIVRTSDLAKRKALNLKLGEAGFNIDSLIARLVLTMGGGHLFRGQHLIERDRFTEMDWDKLGRITKGMANRPPTIGFMLGPLSVEKKERKVSRRQAAANSHADIIRPQELKEEDIQRRESNTTKMVRQVHNLLRQYSPINIFEFVINPYSFSQTIENIFYLSFSVQDARARIEVIGDSFPIVTCVDTLTEEELMMENSQFVFEMTMDLWKGLVEALHITESIIPHRRDERHDTRQAWY